MKVYTVPPLGFAANCYLITEDEVRATAIDPAQPHALQEAKRLGLTVTHVLLTHGHFDHIGGCAAFQAEGAEIGCLRGEEDLALHHNLSSSLGFGVKIPPFTIDFTFEDGEELAWEGLSFSVIATPGHTAGSCCFHLAEGVLFSGDTLFAGDVGRTDLPTGSESAMVRSLEKLFGLEDCTVFPGHGEATTLFRERSLF